MNIYKKTLSLVVVFIATTTFNICQSNAYSTPEYTIDISNNFINSATIDKKYFDIVGTATPSLDGIELSQSEITSNQIISIPFILEATYTQTNNSSKDIGFSFLIKDSSNKYEYWSNNNRWGIDKIIDASLTTIASGEYSIPTYTKSSYINISIDNENNLKLHEEIISTTSIETVNRMVNISSSPILSWKSGNVGAYSKSLENRMVLENIKCVGSNEINASIGTLIKKFNYKIETFVEKNPEFTPTYIDKSGSQGIMGIHIPKQKSTITLSVSPPSNWNPFVYESFTKWSEMTDY